MLKKNLLWFVPGLVVATCMLAVDYTDRVVYGADGGLPVTAVKKAVPAAAGVSEDVTAPAPVLTPAAAPVASAPVPAAKPATAVAPLAEPATLEEAASVAKQGVEFVKAKNWLGVAAIAIFLIMFALKLLKVFEKFGKRWAYIISPILSIAAMLLANLAGGVSWDTVWIVLASGPAGAMLNDLWKRGILGQEPTTPMVVNK